MTAFSMGATGIESADVAATLDAQIGQEGDDADEARATATAAASAATQLAAALGSARVNIAIAGHLSEGDGPARVTVTVESVAPQALTDG